MHRGASALRVRVSDPAAIRTEHRRSLRAYSRKEVRHETLRQANLAALVAHPEQRCTRRGGGRGHRLLDRDTGQGGGLGRRLLVRRARLRLLPVRLLVPGLLSGVRLLPLLRRLLLRRLLSLLLLRPVRKLLVQPPIGWSPTLGPAPAGPFSCSPRSRLYGAPIARNRPGGAAPDLPRKDDDKVRRLPVARAV